MMHQLDLHYNEPQNMQKDNINFTYLPPQLTQPVVYNNYKFPQNAQHNIQIAQIINHIQQRLDNNEQRFTKSI